MSEKIDTILEEIQVLKMGHEVIWTDLLKELNELKSLYTLNKKNWSQLFVGKIMEMLASGVISETISKRIVEIINPFEGKFLN